MKSPILSPRRQRAREREKMMTRAVKVVTSPLPYAIIVIFFIMIIMIFVDIMPISGLICTIAILMMLTIVFGNYWQNSIIWQDMRNHSHHHHQPDPNLVESEQRLVQLSPKAPLSHSRRNSRARAESRHSRSSSLGSDLNVQKSQVPTVANTQDSLKKSASPAGALSLELGAVQNHHEDHDDSATLPYFREDHLDNLNDFFDELFKSIDYSLLLIFLGTFIVIESMATTGLPRMIWYVL